MNRYRMHIKSFFEIGQRVMPKDDFKKPWISQAIYQMREEMHGTVTDILPDDRYMISWDSKNIKHAAWGWRFLKHE